MNEEGERVISVEREGDSDCDHEWVYDNIMWPSQPPVFRKICRKCGRVVKERDISKKETFDSIYRKFYGGQDERES